MIIQRKEPVIREKANGGKGHIIINHLLSEEELKDKCGMFSHVVLKPHCSLGYHQHVGNAESYYIIKGEGIYNDNGEIIRVKKGDVVYCKDGEYHGIENPLDDENLEFIALIIKS